MGTKTCFNSVSIALLLAAMPAVAANTWDGGGADSYWNTANNWDNNAVPSFPAALTFGGSARLANTNNLSGLTVNGFTFDSAAGAFTLGGNAVTLGGSVNFSANPATVVTQTINLPMTLSATRTFYTQTNGVLAVSGGIGSSGNFNLEKQNAGTMILSGVNTFSNQFYITQGTVRFGGNGVLANTNNLYIQPRVANSIAINSIVDLAGTTNDVKAVVLGHPTPGANGLQSQVIDSVGGGLLRLANTIQYYPGGSSYSNAVATISCAMTFPNGNIYVDHSPSNAVDLLISGPIRDGATASKVTKQNPGILALAGTNTYTGVTTVNAGTLVGATGGSCSNSAVTVAATAGNSAVLGVSVTDITKQWTISSLTVNNGGTSSGLQFSFGALTPSTTVAPLKINNAATFTTTPSITISGTSLPTSTGNGYPLMTWGSGGPANTNGMTLSIIGQARTIGSLAVVGSTLYLKISTTEPLSWTGGNGTWDVNNTGNTVWKDNTSASTYYVDGDAVVFDNTVGSGGTVTLNSTVNPASVTVNNPTADYTISGTGAIAGGAALTKSGSGTLTLSGTNTYTGATTVKAGALVGVTGGSCSNSAVTVAATAGNSAWLNVSTANTNYQWTISSLTVNNGGISSGLQFSFGALTPSTTVAPLKINGDATFSTTPSIAITGTSLPASTGNGYPLMTWGASGPANTNGMNLSFPAASGTGANLAIAGNTLYLQVFNTGSLSWAGGNGAWDFTTTNWIWNGGGTNYTDGSRVVFDDTASGTSPITVTLNTNVMPGNVVANLTNKSFVLTGAGSIGGSASLTKNGPGTLTLATLNNTYSGGTIVNGGTLRLGSPASAATNYPGTQAYYQFNNSLSLGQDSSSNANTLVTGGGSPGYSASGQFGGALYLSSASSYLKKTVFPTGVPTGASPFTIALWMKPTNDNGGNQWVSWGSAAGTNQLNQFYLGWGYQSSSSLIETWNNNNDLWQGSGDRRFLDGGFHHVAVTWDGTNEVGYVDGVNVGSATPVPPNVAATNFVVGNGFTGWIDDLLIGNQALTPIQLMGLMAELQPIMPLPTSTALQIASGATVDLNGLDQQVGSLAGAGWLTNSGTRAVTFMTGFDNTSTMFSGSIQGGAGLALTKVGGGVTILSGTNRYNGLTTVNAGTLLINGDNSAATNKVMVANQPSLGGTYQATFGGTGTVGGTVVYGAGSTALFTNGGTLIIMGALIASNNVVHLNLSNNVPAGTYVLATYNTNGSSGSFATYPVIDSGSFVLWNTNYIVTGGGQVRLVVGNVSSNTPIAGVNVYPPVQSLNPSDQYAVRVCAASNTNLWNSVFAFKTACKPDWITDAYFGVLANWTHTYVNFETTVPVIVEISSLNGNPITNAVVHPIRKSGGVTLANGKAYVTLNNPCNVAVDINGQMDSQNTGYNAATGASYSGPPIHTISIHANPVLTNKPTLSDPTCYYVTPGTTPPTNGTWTTLYFLPGVHDVGLAFPVFSGKNYYIPGDAIVYGGFHNTTSAGAQNVRIFGHGTISGGRLKHPGFVTPAIPSSDNHLYDPIEIAWADDCSVEGITIADSPHHSLMMGYAYNPPHTTISSWVKIYTWRANGDGINPFGNGQIRNCFIRTQDDASYVNGVGFSDTVFWNDANGSAFVLSALPNLTNRTLMINDCDVLYHRGSWIGWGPVFDQRGAGGGACGAGIIFSNIVVEDTHPTSMNFYLSMPGRTAGDMAGIQFKNVTITALSVNGDAETINGATGMQVHDLTFDNLSIAGKKILTNPFTTNGYVYNLFFTNSDTTAPVVSGAPATGGFTTPFTINLNVNENYGYYSTNGGLWQQFTPGTGAAIPISGTTSLSIYGQDVLGNNSGTNTYLYTLSPPTTPAFLSGVMAGGGNLSFSVTNSTGKYVVQVSTNLANTNGWITLATNTAPFTFTDTNAISLYQQRFYRVIAQ